MGINLLLQQFCNMMCLWMVETLSFLSLLSPQQSNTFLSLDASTLSCLTLFCYTTAPSIVNATDNGFDSDSFLILIGNCCSACVTNELADFEGVPTKMHVTVKRIGGAIELTHKGTIRWALQDDQGVSTTFYIKGLFYAPKAHCRLLSPQHWSQNSGDTSVGSKGT
jgi:uncharacterized metal-binding protein